MIDLYYKYGNNNNEIKFKNKQKTKQQNKQTKQAKQNKQNMTDRLVL